MEKLVVILIDGMDPDLITKNIEHLPNLSRLIKQGTFRKLQSVCPPDSIPAWATIYTGKTPGEHGVFESIDYLKIRDKSMSMDNSIFKGKTFWDTISNNGDTVGVLNPFIAYPSWNVNGFMISGPVFESGNISVNDTKIAEEYSIPPLGGIVDYPSVNSYEEFLERSMDLAKKQNELAIKLLYEKKPSFFFYGNLLVDRIKHFYWKFSEDEKCRSKKLKNAILDIYILIDKFIERITMELGNEYNLLIISDHGHQRRVTKSLNINEWLRKNGYIKTKAGYKTMIEKLKNFTLSFLDAMGCIDLTLKLSKMIPKVGKLKSSEYINNSKADIFVPKFAGMNPYGGICFNKEKVPSEVIREVKSKLSQIVDNKTGVKVVEWVKDREEVYSGEHAALFPDVIFKLNDDYGINRSFYTGGVIGKNHFYTRISGGHRRNGVFLFSKKIASLNDLEVVNIEKVHDIILDLFYKGDVV